MKETLLYMTTGSISYLEIELDFNYDSTYETLQTHPSSMRRGKGKRKVEASSIVDPSFTSWLSTYDKLIYPIEDSSVCLLIPSFYISPLIERGERLYLYPRLQLKLMLKWPPSLRIQAHDSLSGASCYISIYALYLYFFLYYLIISLQVIRLQKSF